MVGTEQVRDSVVSEQKALQPQKKLDFSRMSNPKATLYAKEGEKARQTEGKQRMTISVDKA